ncbi:hypothetical protein MMC07_008357 [Pseudocyphellaria aurata]|nr:hypothetical protein [Pseudocyphellaria aurata]
MTVPFIQKDTDMEDRSPEDTVSATPNQSMSTARGRKNQAAPTTSTRNWILYLPPEVRSMVYRFALRESFELSTDWLPAIVRHSGVRGLPGLFFTSKLIHRESVEVFHRVNAFYVRTWIPTLTKVPPRRMSDMIQNVRVKITLSVMCHPDHARFVNDVIRTFGAPGVVRETLSVQFALYPAAAYRLLALQPYLDELGHFTNFRRVELEICYIQRPDRSTAALYRGVEDAQRHVLGPATSGPLRNGRAGLTFLPRQFVNR